MPRQGRLARLDGRTIRDLLTAIWELAVARWRLVASRPADLLQSSVQAEAGAASAVSSDQANRVAFAIGAMGARVPWRSDCLVQALAGQRWLARLGIASDLFVGVKPPAANRLDAHAWLTVGDRVLIGGDVADYAEFRLSEARKPR